MANDTPGTAVQVTEQPARAVRQYAPVEDVIPIFDTARFEHYQRIATVMSAASLVPDGLRGQGGAEAVGNCFLVVSLADRLGMDPFMLAQCCSVVHGRLMIEGKAVHAAVQGKLGVQLRFYYKGERGKDERRIYVSKSPLTEEQVEALKPGVYPHGFEDMIDGSVGEWKTFERSGSVKAAWQGSQADMQLRYRGTRVWARANEPGIMLGVYSDDEFDEMMERRAASAPQAQTPRLTAGFGDETDRNFQAKEEPKGDGKKEGSKPGHAQADLLNEEAPASSSEAAEFGHAEPGETYLILGETFSEKGRRTTYQDGKPFSAVGEKGAASLKVYEDHPPAPEKEGASSEEHPTGTAGAPDAEGEPGMSETAGNAASDGPEETSGATASEEQSQKREPVSTADQVAEAGGAHEGDFPGDRPSKTEAKAEERDGGAFAGIHETLQGQDDWLKIKKTIRDFSATDAYKSAEDEGKRMLRMWAWDRYVELQESGAEATTVTEDITLFRFWLEFASENEDQINANFRALFKSEAYKTARSEDQKMVGDIIAARKEALAAGRKA